MADDHTNIGGDKITVRDACRRRMPLDGADAQALEHGMTQLEQENASLALRGDRLLTLLARCVKYAREDRMQTPGVTRLDRALAEAEKLLAAAPGERRVEPPLREVLDAIAGWVIVQGNQRDEGNWGDEHIVRMLHAVGRGTAPAPGSWDDTPASTFGSVPASPGERVPEGLPRWLEPLGEDDDGEQLYVPTPQFWRDVTLQEHPTDEPKGTAQQWMEWCARIFRHRAAALVVSPPPGERPAAPICEDCGEPASGPGDAESVNCDCGTVVCSACCESFDGESYCRECVIAKMREALAASPGERPATPDEDVIRREERERWARAMRADASAFTRGERDATLWAIASLGWARRLDNNTTTEVLATPGERPVEPAPPPAPPLRDEYPNLEHVLDGRYVIFGDDERGWNWRAAVPGGITLNPGKRNRTEALYACQRHAALASPVPTGERDLLAVVQEMWMSVSIVRERTPHLPAQMEAAAAVERWANRLAALSTVTIPFYSQGELDAAIAKERLWIRDLLLAEYARQKNGISTAETWQRGYLVIAEQIASGNYTRPLVVTPLQPKNAQEKTDADQ